MVVCDFYYDNNTTDGVNPVLRGTFDPSNGAYTNNSDRRLKKNISSLDNQLEKILQLRPIRYQFKSQQDEEYSLGLIAQEVQAIIPEVISQISKKGEDKEDFLGVSYSELIPVLLGAIQDQQAIIDAQNVVVSAVKADLGNMNASLQSQIQEMIKTELAKASDANTGEKRKG